MNQPRMPARSVGLIMIVPHRMEKDQNRKGDQQHGKNTIGGRIPSFYGEQRNGKEKSLCCADAEKDGKGRFHEYHHDIYFSRQHQYDKFDGGDSVRHLPVCGHFDTSHPLEKYSWEYSVTVPFIAGD